MPGTLLASISAVLLIQGTTPHEAIVSKGKNEDSDGIGAMLGYVCAALAVGTITGVICTWLVLHRQGQIKDSRKQSQTQPTVSQETELTGATSTLNTYEQLQNRTDTEHRDAYDSLDGPDNQSHPPPTVFQETEFTGAISTLNTYEQLQNRTNTENREVYDSLDANSRPVPNSQSEYECLEQDEEISHTYTDLNQSR